MNLSMSKKKETLDEIEKFLNEGYVVFKNIVPQDLLDNFKYEIDSIVSSKISFQEIFKISSRERIYTLLQNLCSVRKIAYFVENFLDNKEIFTHLGFKCKSTTNGLIISIPNEEKTLNPLHQDIYAYRSSNFVKLWIPMTKVNKFKGSMQIFKGSHKLGFIEPKYKDNKSTYPEINHSFVEKLPGEILDLSVGSFVLFNPLVIHQSINNMSKDVRFTIGVDIQDIKFDEDESLLNRMSAVKKERSNRRLKILNAK
jgi:ectoine hydroxylase-related dioxygenase (phytanoyl-CoA dioxygenase family)